MKKLILAGGTGYLGGLCAGRMIREGWEVVILTRNPKSYRGPGRAVAWDAVSTRGEWVRELEGATGIVNLVGKSVNSRPTAANREVILSSRVNSVRALGEGLRQISNKPRFWIQASSLAIYGDPGDQVCGEGCPVVGGYPATVCVAWEKALEEEAPEGIRSVVFRIGLVMGRKEGALPVLERLVWWGLGGSAGSGKQWVSWVDEADMEEIFVRAITQKSMSGAYNITAPEPVRNGEMMRELRRVVGRPWSPPAPGWAVRLGGWVLGTDPSLVLTGRRCVPERLLSEGFEFCSPTFSKCVDRLWR